MFAADGNDKKSDDAHNHARELAARLKDKFPQIGLCSQSRGARVQIG